MVFPPDIVNEERTPAFCELLKLMKSIGDFVGAEWELGTTLKGLLEGVGCTDVEEQEVVLRFGKTNGDETLAEDGVRSCGLAVEGLSKFAQCEYPRPTKQSTMRRYADIYDSVPT